MEQELEEKRRTKLKKQESFREVQESIKKYESKNEFVQVKLQTRQSFREDQEALNKRLSRRRSEKMQNDGEKDRNKDIQSNGVVASKLENIVLDVKQEKEVNGLKNNETSGHVNNGYVSESPDLNSVRVDRDDSVRDDNGKAIETLEINSSETNIDSKGMPNGRVRGSMTPEPRLKTKGRLYEKNEKLTVSSSNHLDKISLKGVKAANHLINGFSPGPVLQQTRDPLLPAAEITEIPKDGNLRHFSVQQMVTIFRLLNVREDIVHRLFNSNIDGKRFSLFTDKDLKTLGVLNPIVTYFRDRSIASAKKPPQFML